MPLNCLFILTSTNYCTNFELGDVDADLKVSADDARSVLKFASNLDLINTYQEFVSDVDGNGKASADDSHLILRYASNLESSFPGDPFPNS